MALNAFSKPLTLSKTRTGVKNESPRERGLFIMAHGPGPHIPRPRTLRKERTGNRRREAPTGTPTREQDSRQRTGAAEPGPRQPRRPKGGRRTGELPERAERTAKHRRRKTTAPKQAANLGETAPGPGNPEPSATTPTALLKDQDYK